MYGRDKAYTKIMPQMDIKMLTTKNFSYKMQ